MTIINIHIGPHKTGTTTIQRFFFRNRTKFLSNGLLYPAAGIFDQSGHSEFAWDFRTNRVLSDELRVVNQMIDELRASSCSDFVISSEEFSDFSDVEVGRLKDLFSKFEVRIMFFVRNQVDLIRSQYVEYLKQGITSAHPLDFVGSGACGMREEFSLEKFNYQRLANLWGGVFGFDSLRPLVFSRQGTGVLELFLKNAGIALPVGVNLPDFEENKTPSAYAVSVLHFINCVLGSINGVHYLRRRQIIYQAFDELGEMAGRKVVPFAFPNAACRFIESYFFQSNKEFESKFGEGFFQKIRREDLGGIDLCQALESVDLDYWFNKILDQIKYSNTVVE